MLDRSALMDEHGPQKSHSIYQLTLLSSMPWEDLLWTPVFRNPSIEGASIITYLGPFANLDDKS